MASSFRSVADMWHHRIGSTPEAPALRFQEGGTWATLTWGEAGRRVRALANGLLHLGIAPGDRCVILAETAVEWMLADLAILCAGAATTTAFPQTPDAELAFIVGDSGARVVFTDHPDQAARLARLRSTLPDLEAVVVFGPHEASLDPEDDWVLTLRRLERAGRDHEAEHPDAYDEVSRAIGPGQLATLMYTSGTTGEPRGVMLSHDAWIYEAEAIDALGVLTPADVQFLWLPLAHVFAKVLQLSFIRLGIETVIDGRSNALLANLQATHPTWMAAVPRTFEKLRAAIEREARSRGAVAWSTYQWALAIGRRRASLERAGQRVPMALRSAWLAADRLVCAPIRARLGGRLRFVISGGAPLAAEVAEYFDALGLTICEGYGLTESAAASCVNRPGDVRFGTVGPPLPGCRLRIAEDGEILLHSRGLMTGYWHDEAGTAEAFTTDGFLRTGDIGTVLPSGHVWITGRKKEILVTAGAKNVAPQRMEQLLRARCPYVEHVVMHGDGRPYCTALITLDARAIASWAREQELPYADVADLASHPKVERLVRGFVDDVNRDLASYERVRNFVILSEPFTEANGLLTPSAKVRRGRVEARYRAQLDRLYAAPRTSERAAR